MRHIKESRVGKPCMASVWSISQRVLRRNLVHLLDTLLWDRTQRDHPCREQARRRGMGALNNIYIPLEKWSSEAYDSSREK